MDDYYHCSVQYITVRILIGRPTPITLCYSDTAVFSNDGVSWDQPPDPRSSARHHVV